MLVKLSTQRLDANELRRVAADDQAVSQPIDQQLIWRWLTSAEHRRLIERTDEGRLDAESQWDLTASGERRKNQEGLWWWIPPLGRILGVVLAAFAVIGVVINPQLALPFLAFMGIIVGLLTLVGAKQARHARWDRGAREAAQGEETIQRARRQCPGVGAPWWPPEQ
jgi:hypothetical protein